MTVTDPERELEKEILAEAGWVRNLARSLMREESAAADLTQDVLAAAIERRPRLRSRLRGWLRGMTFRLAARRHRDRLRRKKHEALAARPLAGNPEDEAVERLRLHRRLTDAVLTLPEPYRTVVIGRYFDGLPPGELARQRDVSPAVVRQQLHRALAMLRVRLDKEFGSRKAWGAALTSLLEHPLAAVAPVVAGAYAVKKIAAVAVAVVLLVLAYQAVTPASRPAPGSFSEGMGAAAAAGEVSDRDAFLPERAALGREAAARSVSFAVVDSRGAPVAGAWVWVWRPEGDLRRGNSDATGRVSFTGEAGPGRVFAFAPGWVPGGRELPELSGTHRIVLGIGEELQGWARVDGESPRRPIALEVWSETPILPKGLPEVVIEEVRVLGVWDPHSVTTAADGAFQVAGLPTGWSGGIRVPRSEPYWIRQVVASNMEDERSLSLAGSQTGLQLDLTELPIVEGRVVWADTSEPIGSEAAYLDIMATALGGSYSFGAGIKVRPDGSFRHGIVIRNLFDTMVWMDPSSRPPVERFRITASAKGAAKEEVLELDVSGLEPPYQVGTIEIHRAELQHVVVRDTDGSPVSGALVQARTMSEPTDAEGKTTVRFSEGEYRVGAMGYRIALMEPGSGSGTPEDPLVFVLEKGSVLTLRLVDALGEVSPVRQLSASWTGLLFADCESRKGSPSSLHRALTPAFERAGVTYPTETEYPIEGNGTIDLDAEGKAVIPGLTPLAELTVRVTGVLDDVALEEVVVAPGPGERKEVEISFTGAPFAIRGRVLDENGSPLSDATVSSEHRSSSTDETGEFEFEPVYVVQEYELEVVHRGHVTRTLDGVVVSPDMEALDIRLSRGHDVRVRAVDPTGALVPVVIHLEERADPASPYRVQMEPGLHLFGDLPTGRTVFWCEILGKRYEVTHEVGRGDGEVRIEVPEMGELLVPVSGDVVTLAREQHLYLHVHVTSEEDPEIQVEERFWMRAPQFLLPPGTYLVRLDEVRRENRQEISRRMLKGPIEVTVRARELVTLDLR